MDSNSHRSLSSSSLLLSSSSLSFLVDELFLSRRQTRSLQWTNCLCLKKYFFALGLFSSQTFSLFSLLFHSIDSRRKYKIVRYSNSFIPVITINSKIIFSKIIRVHLSRRFSLLSFTDRCQSVLEKCRLAWRRATADEYEECQVIGAFRSSKETKKKFLQ